MQCRTSNFQLSLEVILIPRYSPAFNTVAKALVKELEAEYGDPAVVEQSEFLDIELQTTQSN